MAIGRFRCPVSHRLFRDSGPTDNFLVVFPRSSVWIRHAGARAFLADPTVVTIYNSAQEYERFAASPEGDRCDWFAVSGDLAREISGALDPDAGQSIRPFRHAWAPSTVSMYRRQRELLWQAERGAMDALRMEESVISIVADVLRAAHEPQAASRARRRASMARHRDLANAARCLLGRTLHENVSVHSLAAELSTSPFHLCRVFRACTGVTMRDYQSNLRVRRAFELLEDRVGHASLSDLALELGFASHSHFTDTMRRRAGAAPREVRRTFQSSTLESNAPTAACVDSGL